VLENELLRISVLVDKGTDIFEFLYKPTDTDFMWRSPFGIRDPRTFGATSYDRTGAFMDFYHGGWQECFPTGGPASQAQGVEIGLHGEVATMPWDCRIVEDAPECVAACLSVRTYRTPFLLEKTLRLRRGRAVLEIEERVTNEGASEVAFMWGHHPAIGAPFLSADCRVDLPANKGLTGPGEYDPAQRLKEDARFDWPHCPLRAGGEADVSRIGAESLRSLDLCYATELRDGWYALTNSRQKLGFGMRWDHEVFRHVWFWQVYRGGTGYPWYGRTYNVALEPWTSYPATGLQDAVANGTARSLGPEERLETVLSAFVYEGVAAVGAVDDQCEVSEP